MRAATGGINTHRGAIFQLGLLCAAAGAADFAPATPERWREALVRTWGAALAERARGRRGASPAPGPLRDAGAEAALGFPIVFEVACPAWRRAREAGLDDARVRLQVLFETIAVLDDTNLLRRGGPDGLRFARARAVEFLHGGGAMRGEAIEHARAIHRAFVARRLSPGGAADVLASADLVMCIVSPEMGVFRR